ncbi:hypothetical protein SCP_0902600 [Sparassis crispa]|uniref:Uncharacterized protein n=1 Tax=Sparassis crispa TaxID=139825 RepID=A0A401GVY3_9APHY|nr:hypothetical protein SCP_0902600 [Sparassis crispa]GBE86381.1 hypothetical protein SCP_0902600 [Sparassis crispa]
MEDGGDGGGAERLKDELPGMSELDEVQSAPDALQPSILSPSSTRRSLARRAGDREAVNQLRRRAVNSSD